MEKGPDELAADVFKTELEMSVLENSVVAAIESGSANVEALLIGDFFRHDKVRGVASAGGGDGGIERVRESVAKSYARGIGFDRFIGTRSSEHSRLGGHVGVILHGRGGEES